MDLQDTKRTESKRTESSHSVPKVDLRERESELLRQQEFIEKAMSAPSSVVPANAWSDCIPQSVTSERQVTNDINLEYWKNLYTSANASAADETKKRKIRAAIYVYLAVNGTSRVGTYSQDITTADGTILNSSLVMKACHGAVRKWMRANADEAILFFRSSQVLYKDGKMIARALALGYPAEAVIGIVDFVGDSTLLSPQEKRLNDASFTTSIQRARAARDGESLEAVEATKLEKMLDAQDSNNERGAVIAM